MFVRLYIWWLLTLLISITGVPRVLVVGGGAAGYFAAIEAAHTLRSSSPGGEYEVVVLEAGREPLQKVLISGGGRCNVMHDPSKGNTEVARGYPRGQRELLSPFNSQFGPGDTYEWFRSRGVELKTERDGRVFPVTDQSSTIIEALQTAARQMRVKVLCSSSVTAVDYDNNTCEFTAVYSQSTSHDDANNKNGGVMKNRQSVKVTADSVILATGSSRMGLNMVKKLGHSVEDPLPSLFSFKIDDPKLHALAGVSSQKCTACLVIPPEFAKGPHKALVRAGATAQLSQTGPMLITHQGLTGPAILRLSAFGAKVLSAMQYKFRIEVAWLPGATLDEVAAHLTSHKRSRALVGRGFPRLRAGDGITKEEVEEEEEEGGVVRRLWLYLLDKAKVPADKHWGELSAKDVREIARELTACSFSVTGRGVYRDEFVTCGGVSLKEVELARMESKKIPRLFIAGELLDVDGVTGGYNFQSAWTSGWIAGRHSGLSFSTIVES